MHPDVSLQERQMTDCKYADNLIEQFKDFRGRIGIGCDDCPDKNCLHNKAHIEIAGFEKDYAFGKIGDSNVP